MKNKMIKRLLTASTMFAATVALASCGEEKGPSSYTVKFDSNDPDTSDNKQPSAFNDIVVESGSTIDLTKYVPTYDGWEFDGWYLDSSFGTKYNGEAVTADVKLYAKWVDTLVVTFKTNGGTSISEQSVVVGSTATKPANPTIASKSNGDHTETVYTFEGWYTDEALTSKFDFETTLKADTTLYAKYTEAVQAEAGYSIISKSLDLATKDVSDKGSVPTDTIDGIWTLSNDGNKNKIRERNRTWNKSTEATLVYANDNRATGVSVEVNSKKTINGESTKVFSKSYIVGGGKEVEGSTAYTSTASFDVTVANAGYIAIYAEVTAALGIINTADGTRSEINHATTNDEDVVQYVFNVSAGTYKFYRTSNSADIFYAEYFAIVQNA